MSGKFSRTGGRMGGQRGFTLIEMAIVLIIIGIIIGAVVKGKDLIRSAEQKKLYNQFLSAWELAYVNYYERTGRILGDTNTPDNSGTRDGRCANDLTLANLEAQLRAVGLDPPAPGPTGSSATRRYSASNGTQYTLTISFRSRSDGTASNYNCIEILGMPTELGIAFDRIKDEEMDGTAGSFIAVSGNGGPRIAWPNVTTSQTVFAARLILGF
ncbi:MAG: prepilin-type N-terminal cleavage/methylation domain-containing protein [Deltaproteobacteria bacterium]|nr:prepilin-type N-terminal cleavage/methylation domain-containing protein [Deltaproteobacteria bacterium]MBW1921842.1 prepilin-type N-terminal cleavage/methylation domain-containing protein [Deltaproteobacteria bacterium]MBW1948005.1 prepilin-type N-terminal cleavage/methylation domain-containing protein [Deltaproteobacteria bacterium]MBW2008824.1 prepilin-type N-terminal cleavage/methylation domain-containing protein [Deltaproteobacteria bacterium]MBW2102043.1 prepilin-type N-terminal cleavag